VIILKSIVTTPTLSNFQVIISPVFFVISSAKKFFDFHQDVTPLPLMVSPGAVCPLHSPSDATEFMEMLLNTDSTTFRML